LVSHRADGGAPVARSLMSLQLVQRQGEDKQSLSNEPETMAKRCCKGVKTMEHALTSEACQDWMYMPSREQQLCGWVQVSQV